MNDIFENVNRWLIYAEAKNGVLIGISSGILIFVLDKLLEESNTYVICYLAVVCSFLVISLMISILSFFPTVRIPWMFNSQSDNRDLNLLYYGHLKDFDKSTLIIELINANIISESPSKLDRFYAEQVIINSKIAYRKFGMFKLALLFLLSAILTPFIGVIVTFVVREELG